MINEVAEALANQDFSKANQLLENFPPNDPWVRFYYGQLAEIRGDWEQAEEIYKQLLRMDYGTKLTFALRQGLERLKALQTVFEPSLTPEISTPENAGLGLLILEPIHPETKQVAAKKFARVMNLDPYAVRLLLPSRGWRLYRAGAASDIQRYAEALQAQKIPVFWMPLDQVRLPQVLQVNYLESVTPTPAAMCSLLGEEPFRFEFSWSEVSQRVEGLLPIFEQVLDQDLHGKLLRKEQIQDYAQFCDLHLPRQGKILRIYTGAYQFKRGISLSRTKTPPGNTSWANWNDLNALLNRYLPKVPIWVEFTSFGESLTDHQELLGRIDAQIDLFRREESHWDAAFHLYSCLVFYRSQT
jgi:tetratricopeptide (TPR) repeat protein